MIFRILVELSDVAQPDGDIVNLIPCGRKRVSFIYARQWECDLLICNLYGIHECV